LLVKVTVSQKRKKIGITGNELADNTADLAIKTIFQQTTTDIPINAIKVSTKRKINKVWQSYRDSIPLSNKLKRIKKSTNKWHNPQNLNRRQEDTRTRKRIGHSFLTQAFLINKYPIPKCNKCQVDLTILPIIQDCQIWNPHGTL